MDPTQTASLAWNDIKPLQTALIGIAGGAASLIAANGFVWPTTGQQWASFLIGAAVAGGVLHVPAPRNQAPGIVPATAPAVLPPEGSDPTHKLTTSGGAVDPLAVPKPPGGV
jgi:hypothetical protein